MLAGGGEACSDIEGLRAQSRCCAVASDSTLYRTILIDRRGMPGWCVGSDGRAERRCGDGPRPRRAGRRWSWISTRRWSTSIPRTKKARPRTTSAGSGSHRCSVSRTPLAKRSLGCCGRATRRPTRSPINWLCSTRRSGSFRRESRRATTSVTTRERCVEQCRCGQTPPGAAPASPPSSGPATSGSRSWPARTRRSKQRSAAPPPTSHVGPRRSPKPVRNATAPRSAELSDLIDVTGWPEGTRFIVRREPLHPGAQTSLFPSLEFRFWGHYTDGTDSRSQPTCTCAPTRTSRTTSAGSKPPVSNGSRSPTSTPTGHGWRWCASPQISCAGSSCCASRPARQRRTQDAALAVLAHPARVVRHARQTIVRILDDWPNADTLLAAYQRIAERRLNARTYRTTATVQTRTRPKRDGRPRAAPNCHPAPCRAHHGHARTNPMDTTPPRPTAPRPVNDRGQPDPRPVDRGRVW